jgi:hypothetical protein
MPPIELTDREIELLGEARATKLAAAHDALEKQCSAATKRVGALRESRTREQLTSALRDLVAPEALKDSVNSLMRLAKVETNESGDVTSVTLEDGETLHALEVVADKYLTAHPYFRREQPVDPATNPIREIREDFTDGFQREVEPPRVASRAQPSREQLDRMTPDELFAYIDQPVASPHKAQQGRSDPSGAA